MTFGSLLLEGKERLRLAGIEECELDAWYLLEYVTGMKRSRYYLCQDCPAKERQIESYRELLEKRSSHIPLQYLTGTQEFMGYSFYVNEQVLIPRQDTEILVEEAVKSLSSGMEILDLCTGSGCILLAVLKLAPGIRGVGADLSPGALAVAEKNRNQLNMEAEFLQSNLFERVEGRYDCILSNPPYIPSAVVDTLMEEVREHEPRMALDGREDGLFYYREIIRQSPAYLKPQGMLFFEIGYDQAEAVREMLLQDFMGIQIKKDLAGLDRVIYGRLKER